MRVNPKPLLQSQLVGHRSTTFGSGAGVEGFDVTLGNHASCFGRCEAAGMNGHFISIVENGVAMGSILEERGNLCAGRELDFDVVYRIDRHTF